MNGADLANAASPASSAPRRVERTFLGSGRYLAWAEYGHPDGDPIFWFHGTPGARQQVPPRVNETALSLGFRVIGVERPGTGASSNHRYRRIRDFGADIEQLADELGFERFGAVGLSGGGPYTLAVAHHLPDRVQVASLLGGIGPTRGPDAVWSYTRAMRFFAPSFEVLRSPVGNALRTVVQIATPIADPVFESYAQLLGFADKAILREPQFKTMFLHDLITAQNLRSVGHDFALFARHWGFALEDVQVPVIVWQGLSDTIVPPSHGHHQAARIPNAELHVRAGGGHFTGFSDVHGVLSRMREVWGEQSADLAAFT